MIAARRPRSFDPKRRPEIRLPSRARGALGQVQVAFWIVTMAVIGFYVVGLVMGVFDPLQLWTFSIVVLVLLGLLIVHELHVQQVLRNEDAPGHDELRRELNRQRETRGF